MSAFNDFAENVSVAGKFGATGDHPLIDFLTELAKEFLPALLKCLPMAKKNASGVASALKEPTLAQRLSLRRRTTKARRESKDPDVKAMSIDDLESAFLKAGKKVTKATAAAMLAELA